MVFVFIAYVSILCSLLSNYGCRGIELTTDLEKQYKLFRKPSLKTITTEQGAIYDCVDFYKQHAFDHPLLRNHTFHPEMRPSFVPQRAKAANLTQEDDLRIESIWLKDGGCPKGTVPVRRVSKDDFVHIMQFTERYASRRKSNDLPPEPGTNFALIQTQSNPGTVLYNGVGGVLSVHNLPMGPEDYSGGDFIVQNGNDRLRVGYMVNPTLYQDNRTHLFQYIDAGESHCFNALCPGFVGVSPDIPIDAVIDNVSIYGKNTYSIEIFIYQDPKSGNWWLQTKNDKVIGFWPHTIFTAMTKSASYLGVGGETFSTPGLTPPPMGTGHWTKWEWDTSKIAHCRQLFVVDTNYQQIEPPDHMDTYVTNTDHYAAYDHGHTEIGRLIFYGSII